ncbi:MAG: S9 family peptidase [Microscillaceae bacterium]|nr:S9 family peptidase [Microscillaceae bacterium]
MKHLIYFFVLLASIPALFAQNETFYQKPPQAMGDLVDAPSTPWVSLDRRGEWLVVMERSELPSIAELSQPELRLAGLRLNPRNFGPSRASYFTGVKLRRVKDQKEIIPTGLPAQPLLSYVSWSPDEQKIALAHSTDTGIELWVLEVAAGQARRIPGVQLNATMGNPLEWLPDNQSLVCRIVPADRGPIPTPTNVPKGPTIQENIGKKAPARTYQDLLANADDEQLFTYYTRAQLVKVNLSGLLQPIAQPGILTNTLPSPDGKYVLMETLHPPFSYLVPYYRFPRKVEIWDTQTGALVKTLADLPLSENVPVGFNSVPDGPRSHDWRSDTGATLFWVEAQDGGDARREAEVRDKLFVLPAPFMGNPQAILDTELRFSEIMWGNAETALTVESWWANRTQIIRHIHPEGKKPAEVLFNFSYEDRYKDPGTPVLKANEWGQPVLTFAAENMLLMRGAGASAEGDRPFLDKLDLKTKKKTRLWQSQAPYYEYVAEVIDPARLTVLISRESATEPPNYFLQDLRKGTRVALSNFPHPYPQLKGVQKQVLRYARKDGVMLTADLYLPPAYKKEDGPLPALVWAYPREYKSSDAASQVTGSPYRFTRLSVWGAVPFITQGYAVLDNAAMPILGEGEAQPNDSFVEQLVANAQAVIDEGVRLGVVNPQKVAVGGHSYGAFMTANLLAHCDLFKAGIARSGAYNRTLTPFGFQAEERTYWEAPHIYNTMSPFMNAHQVNEPILLIHGEADNNSGTFPIQSERFYNALKGLGATTRFVLLPFESHGYRARESVLHMLWEMNRWLGIYLKDQPAEEAGKR